MRASHSKLILWFTSDKATLDVVVPHIVASLAQLEHPQLVVSTRRSLMKRLVELHPQGVSQADHLGKLPLHLACEAGKFWDKGVRAIYDAVDSRGRYALHWACASSKSWEGG
jgi:ankyrin repeat protein